MYFPIKPLPFHCNAFRHLIVVLQQFLADVMHVNGFVCENSRLCSIYMTAMFIVMI